MLLKILPWPVEGHGNIMNSFSVIAEAFVTFFVEMQG